MVVEFVIGGVAACGAGFFTNPLEVAKTRMQLQGELVAKGQYTVHYRNVFHAFYTIGRVDGLLALQKGLVPALWYQLFMNGIRLGAYQCFENWGMTKDQDGKVSPLKALGSAALSGCIGAGVGSPFYMVKVQLQALAKQEIAVGHQHNHAGMWDAFQTVLKRDGVLGLWRGVTAAGLRVTVGSSAQLTTFSLSREKIVNSRIFAEKSWLNGFTASLVSGCFTVFFMTPFDVVTTRVYNQGICPAGKGLLYNNVIDCFVKIFKKEGFWGFYKGWGASLFRLFPHTVLSLMFWDQLRILYVKWGGQLHIP